MEGVHVLYVRLHSAIEPFVKIGQCEPSKTVERT
ncbi:hypothetical protein SAMN04490185_4432 [Pseudomonas frederiksbergensis]|uniref:Uncharacterized protein n=1 Tax=Pseudomonas frederiksbergensis TaxID=104087 RepID=A0A1H5EBQ7_9PSED|nr:hypothetical protein SAMN04490185_4432 [Pseudomonas frederiksbergensis]